MRDYRIEMIMGDTERHFYAKAINEYEAMTQARRDNPGFTLTLCVEVLNPEAA